MTLHLRATRAAVAVAIPLLSACAAAGGAAGRLAAPEGNVAVGLVFGQDRAAIVRALDADGVPHRAAAGDADVLVADRCRGAPPSARCRLVFGPAGLYAAQLEVPAAEERALLADAERSLGAPARGEPAPGGDGETVAIWERPGWSIALTRHAPEGEAPTALLHLEYEPAAPPVVLGVPLGRARDDVERHLARQGGAVAQRDAATTTYVGLPGASAETVSAVVLFRAGRAASVTEVRMTPADDRAAMAAWRELAARYEGEIGRAPATSCPDAGPDRTGGDCTATWASARLTFVVGAHRGAGSKHRGAISVYTAWEYPPLSGDDPGPDATSTP